MEVTVDANQITSVQFVNLNESVAVMYPMMESVLEDIETQVWKNSPWIPSRIPTT